MRNLTVTFKMRVPDDVTDKAVRDFVEDALAEASQGEDSTTTRSLPLSGPWARTLSGQAGPVDMSELEALLGKRVRIKLTEDKYAEGVLLRWSDSGEVVYKGDDGDVWHAWPLLGVEAL